MKHKVNHWLLKTEPDTYSFAQLLKDKQTAWNGVRNFQARNFLKQAQVGDLAIIYHSGKKPAAVGIAKVSKASYPDLDPKKPGDWVQIDLVPVASFPQEVSLSQMKVEKSLKDLILIKQSRLSCMPVSETEFETIQRLGGL